MGEALDKVMSSIAAEKAAPPAAPAPTPSPTPAAPIAVTPSPAAPASPEPAAVTPAPIEPDEKPVLEPVIAPPFNKEVPKLSEQQENYLKTIYEKTVAPTQAAPTQEDKGQISEEERVLIDEARNLLNDPLIKAVKEVREKGGDLQELVSFVGLENINKLPDEEILTRELKSLGRTEEQIAEEINNLFGEDSTKSFLERKSIIDPLRKKQSDAQTQKLQTFVPTQPDNKAKIVEINNKAVQSLEGMKDDFVGKNILGVTINDEMWNNVKEAVVHGNGYAVPIIEKNQLKGYDLNRSIKFALFELYENEIAQANIELGKLVGFNELYKQRVRPSNENTASPELVHSPSVDAAVKGMQEKRLQNQNQFKKNS